MNKFGEKKKKKKTIDNVISLHATMMAVAWAILVPASILIARHSKNECHPMWFYLHRGINLISVGLFSASWAIGVAVGTKTFKAHLVVGTLACVLGVMQVTA